MILDNTIAVSQLNRLWDAGPKHLSGDWRHHDQWRVRQRSGLVVVVAEGHLLAEAVADDDLKKIVDNVKKHFNFLKMGLSIKVFFFLLPTINCFMTISFSQPV